MFFAGFFEPKAFNEGYLPEADGHSVYFAEYGNPKGTPLLTTHGGPGGGGCKPRYLQGINLKKYRVIMLDQRGCGKSTPAGEMKNNSMEDTLFDFKRLLDYLNIKEKVVLKGGSWASTVMLMFAERYPKQVKKMVLSQVFLADKMNDDWILEQSGLFYPDVMEKIKAEVHGWRTIPETYAELINSRKPEEQKKAVSLFGNYERVLGNFDVEQEAGDLDDKALVSNRIYLNYFAKNFTLKSNEIMRNVKKIANIPALIVHNRLDFVCPLKNAYDLHKAMPNSKLVIVPEKGHVGKLLYKTLKKETAVFLAED